jgi:hypothetical protein
MASAPAENRFDRPGFWQDGFLDPLDTDLVAGPLSCRTPAAERNPVPPILRLISFCLDALVLVAGLLLIFAPALLPAWFWRMLSW